MEDVLYHYTDANAFMNILEKGRLFATNIAYMNDTEEFTAGVQCASAMIQERLTAHQHDHSCRNFLNDLGHASSRSVAYQALFAVSFSEHGNDLGQWRAYCPNGGGFSIGFRRTALGALCVEQHIQFDRCDYDGTEGRASEMAALIDIPLQRLIDNDQASMNALPYMKRTQHPREIDNVNVAALGAARLLRSKHFAFCKHGAFRGEGEWRIAVDLYGRAELPVEVRPMRGGVLVPYVVVPIPNHAEAIVDVVVGPTKFDSDVSKATAELYVRSQIGMDCKVRFCDIPYRHF